MALRGELSRWAEVTYQVPWHGERTLWKRGTNAAPQAVRTALHDRAAVIADRYRGTSS